jgi:hypothetical protein
VAALEQHLAAGRPEQLAFLAAAWNGFAVVVDNLYLVPAEGFVIQTEFQISLTDDERAKVIRWAHQQGRGLIEAHIHRDGDPAEFSPSDLWGLNDFVPHVWWRLHQPYAALVFGEETFDALAWPARDGHAESVDALRVGSRTRVPTGLTLARMAPVR